MTREEKRAAIAQALADYPDASDHAIAQSLGVSHHTVYAVRNGHRRVSMMTPTMLDAAGLTEGDAGEPVPVMTWASIPWAWWAAGVLIALICVAGLVTMARQRQGTHSEGLPPGAPDGRIVFAS